MRTLFLFIITIVTLPTLAQQTVYTWVDADGVLHFSDSPSNRDAQMISLPSYSASPSQPIEPQDNVQTLVNELEHEPSTQPIKAPPLVVTLTSPVHEQTIRSNRGFITVQSELNRKLTVGETLQLRLNNQPYGAPSHKPLWKLKNIDRGSHQIQIQALKDGKVIALSSSITVHLHRASIK